MNLIKSTSTFSFFTFLSRIFGYLRDFLIAISLGSGPISDAFFVAFRIPNTFRRLFSEGSFNSAFVPSYSSELSKSKKKSSVFANEVFNFLILFLFVIVLIVEIFMPIFVYLIAPGFAENSDKLALTVFLTRITFPFLIFISLASFFSAILNSHNKFGAAAAAPIILNIILILILYFVKNDKDVIVKYLSYGVSFAGLIQSIFLYFYVKKFYKPIINFNFKKTNKVMLFFKKLIPSIFSSGVTQINILVGTIIASFQANAVSYLYYADRIYQINLAIAGIAIGTILLPSLSKYVNLNKKDKIDLIQKKSFELSIFLSLPAMMAIIIASEEITSSLFGYGSFDTISVKNSAEALFFFSFGLPAFSLIKIFSAFLFARHNTKIPFYFSIVSVIFNIIISLYFFPKYGFVAIPIATTISSWINVIMLYSFLMKKKYFSLGNINFLSLAKIVCNSILSCYIFYLMIINFSEFLKYDSSYKLISIIAIVLITFLLYILTSIVTKALKLSDIKLKY